MPYEPLNISAKRRKPNRFSIGVTPSMLCLQSTKIHNNYSIIDSAIHHHGTGNRKVLPQVRRCKAQSPWLSHRGSSQEAT